MQEATEITLSEAREVIASQQRLIKQQQKQIKAQAEQNALLKQQLAELKRMIYGSRSERFESAGKNQMDLGLDDTVEEQSKEEQTEKISFSRKKRSAMKKAVRLKLPAHLPRTEEVIEPDHKPEGSKEIGREVTEILEYDPGRMYVRKIVRPKYGLPSGRGVVIGQLPSLPIPRGNAGPGLLAHLLISKFTDHLPFYRQARQFKRQDIDISESTIGSWFGSTTRLLEPLYGVLKKKMLTSDYLMADESPLPVQDRNKKGKTHRGYHWVYYSPVQQLVCFDYQRSRARAGPEDFLEDFSGALQTDGYTAYNRLEKTHDITLYGCMAHVRRKFEKALDNDRQKAEYVLEKMQALYEIEQQAREEELSFEQRKVIRAEKSAGIIEELEKWFKKTIQKVRPKSAIGQAVSYALSMWPRIRRYPGDGKIEIDNNLVENTIRPMALGRKNYLFAGSHKAAQGAAIMYSLLGTCKMREVEPFAYLRDILERIPDHPVNRLEELLPGNS